MKTKLTLTIEQEVLDKAKIFSRRTKKSLSSIIEEFLEELNRKSAKTSIVESTKGILKGVYKGKTDKEIKEMIYKDKYGL